MTETFSQITLDQLGVAVGNDGKHRLEVVAVDNSGNQSSAASSYASPNGKSIQIGTTINSLFSDDFGGSAINGAADGWTVLPGGLGANVDLGNGPLSQAAIGSGITTGMTTAVAASALTVGMGTANGAELWLLSNSVFAGKEDIVVLLNKSQALAANSIFIGMVEVDPVTLVPLLNPNFAGEFTNRGGAEIGLSATITAYQAEAIGDSSSLKAAGVVGTSVAWTTTQELLIEIDSRDITVQTATIDSPTAKAAGASRVSSQCPNDRKLYKLLMRFRNFSAPASNTNVVIQRVLVVDNYEQRVQISTAEGDSIGSKALATSVINAPNVNVGLIAGVAAIAAPNRHKLISAATGNPTLVKASAGRPAAGGIVVNTNASVRYIKFYNQATLPTVGSGVPIITIPLPPNVPIYLGQALMMFGDQFTVGIAYTITALPADADTSVIGANDVVVYIPYF